MLNHQLTPVPPTRTVGRLLAVAALGSLLFGAVGCSTPATPGTSSAAPTETSTDDTEAGAADTGTDNSANDSATSGDATGSHAARDVIEQAPASSPAQALAAAQKLFAGQPTTIALDQRLDGTLEYDIDLVSATEKYEVELNADTLELLTEEREALDPGDDDQLETFDFTQVVDVTKAAATARQSQAGLIEEWELEGDSDGSVVYEFDIVHDGATDDVEVRVNALSNQLLPRD